MPILTVSECRGLRVFQFEMQNKGYTSYQRANVESADPVRIIVMLYEAAIRNMRQAIGHFGNGKPELASACIKKTLDIVQYLNASLDHEKGGEISANLVDLYEFVRDLLAEANIRSDVKKLEEAISVLKPLHEAWEEIAPKSADSASVLEIQPPSEPINLSAMG